ncbi:site-specific integrase [Paraglaciecola chathamensis]|uniref:site-specific integrase n=1 Tax=Paraglaciecola chathamensis TaxID=368405 RepID=UPI00270FC679|nr:site-specific integrase [Paraglaciecola chathamensis]MDO6558878.1 site-specific integrase [Paraglaciecola chathamensis]
MAFLRKTSDAKLKGKAGIKGVPLILDEHFQVHTPSLRYFLHCLDSVQPSSLGTYGAHICDFISQLEVDGKVVGEVDDNWLEHYKQAIIERDPEEDHNTENYASQVCRSVINYCVWLTERNDEPYLCGPTKNHRIQISYSESHRIKHKTIKNWNKDKRHMQAPRSDWIEKIKPFGPQRPDLAKRYELMIDWGRLGGLRAFEICQLKYRHLPTRETAERALKEERLIPIKLTVTKGSRVETVRVPPSLVLATWDYIDLYRDQTVNKFKQIHKKDRGRSAYTEPQAVFLSDKTGKPLSPISFSSSIRKAFLKANKEGSLTLDERVWAHGLRHNFVTKNLRENDKAGQKHPERLSMQQTRHGSPEAMEPYLHDRFSKDFS